MTTKTPTQTMNERALHWLNDIKERYHSPTVEEQYNIIRTALIQADKAQGLVEALTPFVDALIKQKK